MLNFLAYPVTRHTLSNHIVTGHCCVCVCVWFTPHFVFRALAIFFSPYELLHLVVVLFPSLCCSRVISVHNLWTHSIVALRIGWMRSNYAFSKYAVDEVSFDILCEAADICEMALCNEIVIRHYKFIKSAIIRVVLVWMAWLWMAMAWTH